MVSIEGDTKHVSHSYSVIRDFEEHVGGGSIYTFPLVMRRWIAARRHIGELTYYSPLKRCRQQNAVMKIT